MGRLFLTERGRMLIAYNEEITRWRWARKTLRLPRSAAGHDAELWLCLHEYEGNQSPLKVEVNGQPTATLAPGREQPAAGAWAWHKVDVPAAHLRTGANQIVLRCDAPAMNAWVLALEPDHRNPQSHLSTDRGQSWRNHAMGAHAALRGEYLVRLRSLSPRLRDPKPPAIVYEDPAHPRVGELLELVPAEIRRQRDPWQQVLALRAWSSQAWIHDVHGRAYAPWDPWTILDWTRREGGHGQKTKIAMCVHYGAMDAALLTALGHRARCVINTRAINSPDGHFLTEVWDAARGQWVVHDGNVDAHFEDAGRPLSAADLAERAQRGLPAESCLRPGPGYDRQPPHIREFCRRLVLPGVGWRHTGVWTRNNYISDPTSAPPSHGSVGYCETDIVWYNPAGQAPTPMFPFSTPDRGYFDQPPAGS